MKTRLQALIVLSIILLCSMQAFAQGVVISEDENATADPSALLDVQSGDKGFLPPRMTTAEWNAIADPANGLVVYDTVENKLLLYNGTEWVKFSADSSRWAADGEDIYRISGNVGIGEEVPVGKLHVSSPGEWAGIMFTGTGLNDLSTDISGYTGTGSTEYAIRIQNAGPDPNQIEISDDGGSTWSAPMDIVPDIDMGFGVTANFGNTYGHIFGDRWDWTVNESFSDVLVVSDDMVGIGTQTPHAELEVAGDIHVSGGDRSIFNRSDQALAFGTNNTERMRIASSGDVGIGTSNPVHPLHVETAASVSPSRAIFGLATAGSGLTYGVHGESSSPEGTGVYGLATAGSGTTYGVHGQNSSTDGTGVFGEANAVDGFLTYGVHGSSISGTGVFGEATGAFGETVGVHGESSSTEGTGVYGLANAGSGFTIGVHGKSSSTDGVGVYGEASAGSGFTSGVYAVNSSTEGDGIFARATASSGVTYGVRTWNSSTSGYGVYSLASASSGTTYGVYGQSNSTSGSGVFGVGGGYGVEGQSGSSSGSGVFGVGGVYGVEGQSGSTSGSGVFGQATASSGVTFGVYAESSSTSGHGVYGLANASSGTTYGVYGSVSSPDGYAGYFAGPAGSRNYFARPVGIGTLDPDASAALDVTSTTKGFLPPRLTETQRDAISSPAEGLMIYNSTTGCPNYYSDGWYEVRGTPTYPPGTVHCNPANPTDIVAVLNPLTGKTWMDRNLGASRVATSSNDSLAYGDLYQWGRGADGHQCHSSATDTTLSSTDQPGHGNFIVPPALPFDWRNPQNGTLWQGVNGVNNPCPTGYRLPTDAELDAERASWGEHNAAGAFASPLKLTVAGGRLAESGLIFVGSSGFISSSTVSGTNALSLYFDPSDAFMNVSFRAYGLSVRCIKD